MTADKGTSSNKYVSSYLKIDLQQNYYTNTQQHRGPMDALHSASSRETVLNDLDTDNCLPMA